MKYTIVLLGLLSFIGCSSKKREDEAYLNGCKDAAASIFGAFGVNRDQFDTPCKQELQASKNLKK